MNTKNSENTWLDIFLIYMYKVLEKNENIFFVVSSRLYSRTQETRTDVSEIMYMHAHHNVEDIYVVNTGKFDNETVSKWIDQFAALHGWLPINRSKIKQENGKIMTALSNPLFLYIFMKKYEENKYIVPKEGFYFYYDTFIEQTIKGKFYLEEKLGAKVIENYTNMYRRLLQEIAFDILKKFNTEITATIIQENIIDSEPLLG